MYLVGCGHGVAVLLIYVLITADNNGYCGALGSFFIYILVTDMLAKYLSWLFDTPMFVIGNFALTKDV